MSKATKRKHVTSEVMYDFILPEPNQQIVKVIGSRGNNLHEVVTAKGETFLVSMPTKFRKNVWIKRGDFVIVDPIEEGDKVKGEIVHILYYKEQIKYIKNENLWPVEFMDNTKNDDNGAMIPDDMLPPSDDEFDDEVSCDDDDNVKAMMPVNPNHRVRMCAANMMGSDDDDDDDD
ncbi:hypothetical protein LSH36_204g05023 [Paralvinella palmiformis]|uniref:Probable RNA-binding protein EIF1AD n=1 Tax=Paralvinella palmiformis TaxID=53620 RepID=A0AAD9JPH7_9ANNE|nr:hypothetical protein LSH36_204g05023 [Paralvinella palmiformis]